MLLGGPCGDNATWSLQYGILTLEGTGKVEGWYTLHDWFTGELIEKRESPWKDYSSGIKEVHVGDGITGLGQFMFGNLPNLKKAVFADSVKVIDNTIFANDKLLTDIILGNGLEEIGDDAFFGTGVTKLVLPSSRNLQGSDPMRYE